MPDKAMAQAGDGVNPFWSPDLFVGRHTDVKRLEDLLREGRSALLIGGRRAGKTTVARRLSADSIQRALVHTDVAGWDLSSQSSALGALRGALEGVAPTTYAEATRHEIVTALEDTSPVSLVIDEADQLLLASWGPAFYAFLRWLDDTHLRRSISILLIGGPVLMLYRDPDDKGSPPLNTAESRYISPLGRDAVVELVQLAGRANECDEIMSLCGGHAWLTTQLLAEMWEGSSFEDASDTTFDKTVAMYKVWAKQLGEDGRNLLRRLPIGGVPWSDFRKAPWARYREAAVYGQCIGAIRRDSTHVHRGPRIFTDWFAEGDSGEFVWDVAISYATEDVSLASQIHAELRSQFRVFFAHEESAALWGTDLNYVLPNTYGVQSKYVLVLSTPHYVSKHWTMMEYRAAAAQDPGRILLLDLGALPDDLPKGVVFRGGSPAEMVGLVNALRTKLARDSEDHRLPGETPSQVQALEPGTGMPLSGQPLGHGGQSVTGSSQSPAITLGEKEPRPAHKGHALPEVALISATLVTIHGYWSSPATWERLSDVWRADQELRGLRIHPFGYPSPKKPRLPFSVTRVPDYDDIAQTLANEYATALANASEVAVVTHSQGGLILQRFLAWMVNEGRARELSRIRSVVMLACPNGGSEYLESVRSAFRYSRHPQAGNLSVLNRQVADTQRTVLQRIVNAAVLDDHQCPIPFHVYAGASDNIVRAASAQAAFPGASTIAGNHFTILDPSSPGNRTAETVKRHLLADITAPDKHPGAAPAKEIDDESEPPAADSRTGSAKYVVNIHGAHGLQIGDHNVQRNVFPEN